MGEQELLEATTATNTYLPYLVTILCSTISGFASYWVSRKQTKDDLQKIEKQHVLDIQKEREKFFMEKEKMELEHKYQLELKQKELENQMGANFTNTLLTEAMKMPEVRQQFAQGVRSGTKKHK